MRERLRYYLSLNSLPLHYHSGGCRLGAASSAAIKGLRLPDIDCRLDLSANQSRSAQPSVSGSMMSRISMRRLLTRYVGQAR